MFPANYLTRRDMLLQAGTGFGALAFSSLLAKEVRAGSLRQPHHPAKAKSVIFLFMEGGPSHLDTFDYKPLLNQLAGQQLPASFKPPITAMGETKSPLLECKRNWKHRGESGLWISDWFENVPQHAADLAVIRSCVSDGINHAGGVCMINTGSVFGGRP